MKKMEYAKSKRSYRALSVRLVVLAAFAAFISANPVKAQEAISGSFTLNENARFGSTVLAPGAYKFSIEPVGLIHSIRAIQQGAGHLVLVVVRPQKSGSTASIFAMASPSGRERSGSELVLDLEKAGTLLETMYLEKEGLKVSFEWATAKGKATTIAQQSVPVVTAAVQR
jgi:hypothetical protein